MKNIDGYQIGYHNGYQIRNYLGFKFQVKVFHEGHEFGIVKNE